MGNKCAVPSKEDQRKIREEINQKENAKKAADKRAKKGPAKVRRRSSVRENFSTSNGGFIQQSVHQALRKHRSRTGVKALNSILMKFVKIEDGLLTVREAFKTLEKEGTNAVEIGDMEKACEIVQLECPDDVLRQLMETGCDPHDLMSFKEFIVTLSLVYLLRNDDDHQPLDELDETEYPPPKPLNKFEEAIASIVDAFNFFDKENLGVLKKVEVMEVFQNASRGRKDGGGISMKRFQEMDWDQNGQITFTEFLFAFESWVGLEDGLDDEEEV
mmetsp:Transcript_1407/g.2005  ORF Transcript_1407/g.2005 Transcript_1407/m.2005 type:complete len:273 (+) Transcript_1407:401-1219(+)|eukprot:CAMPEP_0196581020 /NCGR_PEP_ID=MMETSP1081-20130531/31993_1 /TAXON_ID=36882 /ORGANISM="Pyramimonas amylifera, Strain CCMP720" /LENGTH=272 /DNA_ID=CAMNT_0041901099 /DNA_START=397 /DNA_END=1215 /DNA_ORIENTATION=-